MVSEFSGLMSLAGGYLEVMNIGLLKIQLRSFPLYRR